MRLFKAILPLVFSLSWLQGIAQVFPVQATTQLRPPYSLFLSDYAAPGSERLALNVFLVDAGRPELNVRFRLRIEGQGIRIETKPEFLPPPTSLTGGVPLQLISADLAPYFESRNLNFTGISQREYEQRGALPEGLYQFCFEVLEYNRGVKISNTSCAAAWLILNDPPIVNLPRDGEKVRIQEPQQVIFQWTPRHTGSPNSAFSTEYDFKMVEIWPPTRNPNDAILTSPPVFETTTNATTLIYGPAETPLEPGRRYAIQLKARSVTGVEELNLFKNNGLSQVYTFQYGDACNTPTNIVGEAPGPSRIALRWNAGLNETAYKVRYRPFSPSPPERGAGGEVWYTDNIFFTDHEIKSLQPNTRYEYQIASTCGTFESTWSTVASITTPDVESIAYSCGLPMAPFNLDPSQLIDVISVGDVIRAGDFDVKISKVTGSAGTFSGEGVIEVSYFNKAKVKAEFANIVVNKELRMVNGFMNVTGAGVEIIPAGVMDFMDKLDETLAQVDSLLNEYEANLPQQFDPGSFVADTAIRVNGTIASVTKDESGNVVIVDSNGNRTTVPAGTSAAVTDSAGNGYVIQKDAATGETKVTKVEEGGLSAGGNASASVDGAVKFPFFVVYGCDMDKTIFYCTSTSLDAKVKSDLEALIKEKMSKLWPYMPSDVVITSDCKAIYPQNGDLNVRKGSISWSEKDKKIFFSNLTDKYDYTWNLNGADYTVTEPLAVKDLKTGSNSLELQVIEKAKGSLFSKVSLQVQSGEVDMASYRLRVDRNDKVYYYDEAKTIGGESGELPIDNETIVLTLEHREGNDWKATENTEWSLDKEKAGSATRLSVAFNDSTTHVYVDAVIPGSNRTFRVYFNPKDALKAEEANTILNVEVRGLSTKNEKKRRELFAWSMGKVKELNPTLYNYMTRQIASTQAYIVTNKDTEYKELTKDIKGNVKGVTDVQVKTKSLYYPLLEIANIQLDGGTIIKGGTLVAKLEKVEQGYVKDAIIAKTKTDQYNYFYGRIKRNSAGQAAILDTAMVRGKISIGALDSLRYTVGIEDIDKFIDLISSKKKVYINDDNIGTAATSNSEYFEATFTKTLAHELVHIYFKLTNKLDYLTWRVLREKKDAKHDLKDQLGNNCGCSAGIGHECHNRENTDVCNEENNYNSVKR